ncbi:MAG: Gfo/Idh/MocA family oxidoreductase [Alphaproteobacteria bacterium]|nr:Gfo/Idh/MocA family oxidoreductase [Alphaproteobacteria bacterium]
MLRWGIIGVGRAGRARARAIAEDPRSQAVLGFRGDPGAVGLATAPSVSELLRKVDAVAICAPDTQHPQLIRAALSRGLHVLTEFPLAGSADVGADLLAMAADRGVVLHVEHIELLGPVAHALREHTRGLRPTGGGVTFTGGSRKGTYGLAHANVARLHRIVDALGLPDRVRVTGRGPGFMQGDLQYGDAELDLDFRLQDGLPRHTGLRIEAAGPEGPVVLEQRDDTLTRDGAPVALPTLPGLFLQDQLCATARILDGAQPYVTDERVLQVLAMADALVRASPEGGFVPWEPAAA